MKKIIFALSLAILFCLALTVLVDAQGIELEEIPDELKTGENDTATHFIVIEDEKYFNLTGTRITSLNSNAITEDLPAGVDADKIGKEYLTRFNFPAQIGGVDVTEVYFETVKGNSTYFSGKVGYVQLAPSTKPIGNMNGSTAQIRCFDFGENNTVTTTIPGHLCNGANKLKLVKNFPQSATVVELNAFGSCYLATFEGINVGNFTSVGNYAFGGCNSMLSGEIYVNATTIGDKAFDNCLANVTKLTLGPNVTSIGSQAFTVWMNEIKANKPADQKIQVTAIEFQCKVSAVTINSQAFYFGGSWARSEYSHLKTILLAHPDDEKAIIEGTSIFYNFTKNNAVIPFDGTDGSTYFVTPKHTFVESDVSYDNGFFSNGATAVCSNCGKAGAYTAAPIFSCGGYSIPIDGTMSISILYMVDYDALKAYEEASGNTLNFGLIVGFKSVIGNNAPLDENGEQVSDSLLQIKVPSNYTNVEVKVNNIPEESAETVLLLCGYVKETDSENNVIGITYVEETEMDAENLVGVSFQALLEKSGEAEQ